jgi:hypothetical protein
MNGERSMQRLSKMKKTTQRTSFLGMIFRAQMVVVVLGVTFAMGQAHAITLTPISTGWNSIIGIDHHSPTNQAIISVNYPFGLPHNLELVAADGTHSQFSNISGFNDELKIATVRSSSCQGGFIAGELFVGTGVPGVIARISPDGSVVQNPWVTLPNENGLMRGGFFHDRFCSFGGDLITITTAGSVWRVTSAGIPTKLASLGTHLEGVTTVPNDVLKYGPWAGKILAGAEQQGCVYSIDALGNRQCWSLGINPEDIDIIPTNGNFFGVDYGGGVLWGAPASEFAGMTGDVLITQEAPGLLWHVRWDAASNAFQATQIAQVTQWEHVTFSTAGIQEIPPIMIPPTIATGRMTGGGSVLKDNRVTHGFELHCDPSQGPNNLQVDWGKGDKFHLESLTSVSCTDDPKINGRPPVTGLDTYVGSGKGRYNGVSGATAKWTFTDAGEPGKDDFAEIAIADVNGNTVLTVSGFLNRGNHQAHKK